MFKAAICATKFFSIIQKKSNTGFTPGVLFLLIVRSISPRSGGQSNAKVIHVYILLGY